MKILKFWSDITFEDILKSLVSIKSGTENIFLMVYSSLIV